MLASPEHCKSRSATAFSTRGWHAGSSCAHITNVSPRLLCGAPAGESSGRVSSPASGTTALRAYVSLRTSSSLTVQASADATYGVPLTTSAWLRDVRLIICSERLLGTSGALLAFVCPRQPTQGTVRTVAGTIPGRLPSRFPYTGLQHCGRLERYRTAAGGLPYL